jgi:hypothetical protein
MARPAFALDSPAWRSSGLGGSVQKSIRKLRSSAQGLQKAVQSPSENFNRFLRIDDYQWLTGDRRPKNSNRALERTWSRATEENGPTRALTNPVNCVSRPRAS